MKLTYTPATLTAEHLPTYIRARSSPDITRAARHALEALETLARALTTDDLIRHAVVHSEDPATPLAALAATFEAALSAVRDERNVTGELLRNDSLQRHALDMAAMEVLSFTENKLRHHQRLVSTIAASAEREMERLRKAGLSAPEVDALLDVRNARPDPQIAEHQQQAEACARRLAALESFLGDRLRDTAALGDDLLAELRERAAAIPLRATMTDPEDAARRAKIVKDADARGRLIARLTGTQQHVQPSAQA